MKTGPAVAAYLGISGALAGAGAGGALLLWGGAGARSAAAGVGIGWAAMAAGFLLLAANWGRSGARFLGSYVAGVLLRLAVAGGAAGLAASGTLEAVPALAALAFTYAGLLAVECAVLGAAGR